MRANDLLRIQRIARMERALKWYANPKHWSTDGWGVRSVVKSPDYGDPGKKARNPLRES